LINQSIGQSVVSWLDVTFRNYCHHCSWYCAEHELRKLPCNPSYLKQQKEVLMEFWLQKSSMLQQNKKQNIDT